MRTGNRDIRTMLLFVVTGLVAGTGGCLGSGEAEGPSGTDEPDTGTLSFNLVGQTPTGHLYRLRDARITVTGNGATKSFNTEQDPTRTSLSSNVGIGDYVALVDPGWRIERIAGSVTAPVVNAALVSPNPVAFSVQPHQRTEVSLRFRVDEEEVDMAQGYDIVLETDEVLRHGLVVTNFNNRLVGVFSTSADGNTAPRRTISGPDSLVVGPHGVTVVGDEMIVVDRARNAIDVFALDANGNTPPRRRIIGDATKLSFPSGVIVQDGEIYVVQETDTILVFALGASGNVPPRRTISGINNGQQIATDGAEIYVTNFTGEVRVYPKGATGSTGPNRVIRGPLTGLVNATGVAVRDSELFVADGTTGQIRVFALGADGDVAPLRVINEGSLGFIDQLAVFNGEVYVALFNSNVVAVFPANAQRARVTSRLIGGENTALGGPFSVAVF